MTKSELKDIIKECLLEEGYNYIIESSLYGFETYHNSGKVNCPDTSNLKSLEKELIKVANSRKFTKKDYHNWGYPGYGDGKDEDAEKEFSKYKFGYCYLDQSDNYIVYNFTNSCFCFFDHEYNGLENINHKKSIDWIAKYINSDLDGYKEK